jgi:superfamily II DNA or RNA helicase
MRPDPLSRRCEETGGCKTIFASGCDQEDCLPCRGQKADTLGSIQELYGLLACDAARNDMIFNDVLSALEAGRSPVVITERKDHLQAIAERLTKFAKNVIVLKGGMGAKQRNQVNEILQSVPDSEERVIVATGRYLGEGFDDARLDTLFLTMPISWRGTLAQYAGRLHRLHAAKREVIIFDYVDGHEPTHRVITCTSATEARV